MQPAIDNFNENIVRAEAIHHLYHTLHGQVTAVVDLSDLLRFEVVQSVSALDCFVHDLALFGMLEVVNGIRPRTPQFEGFQISAACALQYQLDGDASVLQEEIRRKHGFLSFQHPDRVADAIRLFSSVELWNEIEVQLGAPKKSLKTRLALIVDRRNKIAHEGDLDPSYPGQRWPIASDEAEGARLFIQSLGSAIFTIV